MTSAVELQTTSRILVVEDDPGFCKLVTGRLQEPWAIQLVDLSFAPHD